MEQKALQFYNWLLVHIETENFIGFELESEALEAYEQLPSAYWEIREQHTQ